MTKKKERSMGTFRELTIDEMDSVSGGWRWDDGFNSYTQDGSGGWSGNYSLGSVGYGASFANFGAGTTSLGSFGFGVSTASSYLIDHGYFSVGGGADGLVGGVYFSMDTGPGVYFGLGTPGPSFQAGVSSDNSATLNGFSVGSASSGAGFSYSGSNQALGYSLSSGPSSTYGISYGSVIDEWNGFVHAVVDVYGIPYNNLTAFQRESLR